jgi:hypothetical protein
VISGAAATVLTALYGNHLSIAVTSPTLPGITRTFHNFRDVATEAGLSRIYAGVHTRPRPPSRHNPRRPDRAIHAAPRTHSLMTNPTPRF